jgi:alkyl sulfatase BDS1-like metallo-beta-lactamase superfamily hydrolase
MNQVVFANPANRAARELGADALEQLGFQAEAGTWRNAYLVGAMELRNGLPRLPPGGGGGTVNPETLRAISNEQFFDYLGVRLNAEKAEGKTMLINWTFVDTKQQVAMTLENAALIHVAGKHAANADATVTLARDTLNAVALGQTSITEAVKAGRISVEGDASKLEELFAMLDTFSRSFPVIEPKTVN